MSDRNARTQPWQVMGRSVRGVSHVREGLPNQDALATVATSTLSRNTPLLAALADGHGGARHFRSDKGSALAVAAANAALRAAAPAFDEADDAERSRLAAVALPQRIVADWLAAVQADLLQHPVQPDEWQRLEAAEGPDALRSVRADPVLAYGATLLAAMVTPRCSVVLQLGDGDVLAVDESGRTLRPVPADERLGGNLTTSLCRPDAAADFRSAVLDNQRAPLALLMLATDGYANSFRTDADFLQVGGDFLRLVHEHGLAKVEQQLGDILEHASNHGSGDDITVALLVRDTARRAGRVAGDQVPPTTQPDPALADAHARIDRLRWAVAALGLALLATIGWGQRAQLRALFAPAASGVVVAGPSNGAPKDPPGLALPQAADPGLGTPPLLGGASAPTPAASASGEGGLASIERPAAARVKGGVEITAHLKLPGIEGLRCVVRAAVLGAHGKELGSASSKLGQAAQAAETDVRLLVATPTDESRAKAMTAATLAYALRVDCAGAAVAKTEPRLVDAPGGG